MHNIPTALIPRAASFFKVVGDETRMKILCAISQQELCVNDIAEAVGMTKSAVSHQLKLLKDEDLIKPRREGKNIFYSLDDQHVVDILDIAFIHIGHKCHGEGCGCSLCRDAKMPREDRCEDPCCRDYCSRDHSVQDRSVQDPCCPAPSSDSGKE